MNLKERIRSSEFVKNVVTLTFGTSIAQLVPILFYPVLSRLFTPSEFGLLALFTSITGILSVIATGKYQNGILISTTKRNGINLIALVLFLSAIILLLFLIIIIFFAEKISSLFNVPALSRWLFLCPIASFAIIIYSVYNEWCVRNKYFKNLSNNKILNASATTLNKFVLGVAHVTNNGLIWGDVIGRIISAINCLVGFYKRDKKELKNISIKRIRVLAKKYVDFPKYSLPEGLVDTINTALPVFAITTFFLSSETGYFNMANSVLSVPSSVISLAVMDVFRQRANEEWQQKGNCINIYKKAVRTMLIIIIPISIILFFVLPELFEFVLGKNWRIAGVYAKIILPNVVVLFVFQVVSAVFIIANKMRISFVWQIFSISLTILSLYIGCIIFNNIIATLIFYVIARIIANLSRFYLTYRYSKGRG